MTASTRKGTLDLSSNAIIVLERRYLVKDDQGRPVERPEDLFWRVARTIAEPDRAYGASDKAVEGIAETFFELMATRAWMPNSPTLMNAGRPLGQLSACFVLPVDDALSNGQSGIYDTLRAMALVHQSGGGTGYSFSRLRPKNDVVRSTMGVASSPVSFMKLYDASTDVVKQGGTRRGANMGILRVDHPDVLEFIGCKNDLTQVTNFIRKIVHGAWKTGEPGVYFLDRANYYNPVPHLGSYEATNPCGEQPLLPYDVCNLGSINLGLFVKDGAVDWDRLRTVVHLCTHFLDNVIDANKYPLDEIDRVAKRIRRIGLGVMGWADLLVRLGIPYNSDGGVALGRKVMDFVDEEAKAASEKLAEQRGVFAEWERSIWGPDTTCARGPSGERVRPMRRLRNCNLTTVAPTGTISILAGCSSGIEPLFAVAFMRNQAGVLMPDVNEDFVGIAKQEGWYSDALMQQIAEAGHIHFDAVPAKWQRVFVTAHDVTPEWHIQMQAAFQEFTDSAISKTCNFANDATEEYVEKIYRYAYQLGCKGVTVYRDGAREMQVLSTGSTAKKVQEQATASGTSASAGPGALAEAMGRIAELEAELARTRDKLHDAEAENLQRRAKRSRPDLLKGATRRVETPLGTMYVNITEDDKGQPFEVFISLGKAGGALMADVEAIGRLISLALRSGIPMREVYRQLRGISSDRVVGLGPNKVLSVPDAIGIAIEKWMQEKQGIQQDLLGGTVVPAPVRASIVTADGTAGERAGEAQTFIGACPDCGSQLAFIEGCAKCHVCGFSECG
ncbi:MAG: adenosylcobalamin-dependent ribonucleoside-diphosphate reductase [Gemmatimonadetes bacterium]|nr:MAG: adenosylcobalamin-dependent ribonucleoside-diphosphate reductase [Gemmatimonadota bacterium]